MEKTIDVCVNRDRWGWGCRCTWVTVFKEHLCILRWFLSCKLSHWNGSTTNEPESGTKIIVIQQTTRKILVTQGWGQGGMGDVGPAFGPPNYPVSLCSNVMGRLQDQLADPRVQSGWTLLDGLLPVLPGPGSAAVCSCSACANCAQIRGLYPNERNFEYVQIKFFHSVLRIYSLVCRCVMVTFVEQTVSSSASNLEAHCAKVAQVGALAKHSELMLFAHILAFLCVCSGTMDYSRESQRVEIILFA